MFGDDNSTISRTNMARLLNEVKHYSDLVSTMKFPTEWENILLELSKKGTQASSSGTSKKEKTPPIPINKETQQDTIPSPSSKHTIKNSKDASLSEKDESAKEDSDENETHTVQIEIRGNTGGFVGAPIEFDLVVTHEDGSPVKVQASDFAVEIHGPAASSPVIISTKGKGEEDGAFRIEFKPTAAGANTLSIFMHNTLLTSGIKSVISKAGEIAFLVHTKGLLRGQLQGISVIPLTSAKSLSRTELLKQKLQDIATVLEMLETIRTNTIAEMETLSISANDT